MILLFIVSFFGELPSTSRLVIDENTELDGADFLSDPYDALYHRGALYIADEGQAILQFVDGKYVRRIGRIGQSGSEFRHQPVFLSLENETLVGYERYGHARLRFDLNGRFLERQQTSPRDVFTQSGERFVRLHHLEAFETGRLFVRSDDTVRFGTLASADGKGFHQSRSFLLERDSESLLVIGRSGLLEIWDRKGTRLQTIALELSRFSAEIEEDEVATLLHRRAYRDKIKQYRYGQPIFHATLESPDALWLLVRDEHTLDAFFRPTRVWLFRVDPVTGAISFRAASEHPLHAIKWNDGHLTAVSREDAVVWVYDMKETVRLFSR